MMNKSKLKTIVRQGWDGIRAVSDAIKELTAEKPLVLFTKEQVLNKEGDVTEESIEIYDLPYGYYVDKYSTYIQGAVMNVQGHDIQMFATGDEFGTIYEIELSYVPFECQLPILQMLIERE